MRDTNGSSLTPPNFIQNKLVDPSRTRRTPIFPNRASLIEMEILSDLAKEGPDAQRRFLEAVIANPYIVPNDMGALIVQRTSTAGLYSVLVQTHERLPIAFEATERHAFEVWQAMRVLSTRN